ncbi:MAG: hypothetical protein NHG13_00880 [Candidatus Shikimatogenerans bostrichidophilus]|nr:MAG: hypothetical protein NHG13_00880 [Candidatus Shikimatogenerans bostrichidophilus]
MKQIKIKNYIRIKVLKILYIYKYNKIFDFKLYINKIIKNIKNINNLYLNKIKNKIFKKKYKINKSINYYINKIKYDFYFQYEEKKIIKFILFYNIKNKKQFNLYNKNNIDFLYKLYLLVIKKKNILINLIKKKIKTDLSLINVIDLIIIKMAICEFFFIKNNINIIICEYINITKLFSSIKSKVFINGILDNIFNNVKL